MRRRAVFTACPTCATPLLVGTDEDWAGLTARVELGRLSAFGEAMALGQGRRTVELDPGGRLYRRADHWRIRSRRADVAVVLAEHVCNSTIPTEWLTASTPRKATSNDCPF